MNVVLCPHGRPTRAGTRSRCVLCRHAARAARDARQYDRLKAQRAAIRSAAEAEETDRIERHLAALDGHRRSRRWVSPMLRHATNPLVAGGDRETR